MGLKVSIDDLVGNIVMKAEDKPVLANYLKKLKGEGFELLDGMDQKSGDSSSFVTGTSGNAGNLLEYDANGNAVDSGHSYVANEHIDHTQVSIQPGDGLGGGGDLTGNRPINLRIESAPDLASPQSDDEFILSDTSAIDAFNPWAPKKSDIGTVLALYDSKAATLTNKTFDANNNTLSNVSASDLEASAKTGADSQVATGTAGTSGQLAEWNSDGDLVGKNLRDSISYSLSFGGNITSSGDYFVANGTSNTTPVTSTDPERIHPGFTVNKDGTTGGIDLVWFHEGDLSSVSAQITVYNNGTVFESFTASGGASTAEHFTFGTGASVIISNGDTLTVEASNADAANAGKSIVTLMIY